MQKKRRLKKKYAIFFSISLYIFCSSLIINTLSKYDNSVNKTETIDVARWSVSAVLPNDTLNIVAGNGAQNYNLSVTSTSEVANTYSVIISNLPSDVSVSIDGGNYVSPINNVVEFTNAGSFQANDNQTTKNHILSFQSNLSAAEVINRQVDIDVIFSQSQL